MHINKRVLVAGVVASLAALLLAAVPVSADLLSGLLKGTAKIAGEAVKVTGKAAEVAVGATGEAAEVAVGASAEAAGVAVGATGKALGMGSDGNGSREKSRSTASRPAQGWDPGSTYRQEKTKDAPKVSKIAQKRRKLERKIASELESGAITEPEARSLRTEVDALMKGGRVYGLDEESLSESERAEILAGLEHVQARLDRYLEAAKRP